MKLPIVYFCIVMCMSCFSCTENSSKLTEENEETLVYIPQDSVRLYIEKYLTTIQHHDSLTAHLERTIGLSERLIQLKHKPSLLQIEHEIELVRNTITQFNDSSQVLWNELQTYWNVHNTKIETSLQDLVTVLEKKQ